MFRTLPVSVWTGMYGVMTQLRPSSENTLYSGRYVVSNIVREGAAAKLSWWGLIVSVMQNKHDCWYSNRNWLTHNGEWIDLFCFLNKSCRQHMKLYLKAEPRNVNILTCVSQLKCTRWSTNVCIVLCISCHYRYIMIAKKDKDTSSSISWTSSPIFPSLIPAQVGRISRSSFHSSDVWSLEKQQEPWDSGWVQHLGLVPPSVLLWCVNNGVSLSESTHPID